MAHKQDDVIDKIYICEKHGEADRYVTFHTHDLKPPRVFCMQCIKELLTNIIGEMKIKEKKDND